MISLNTKPFFLCRTIESHQELSALHHDFLDAYFDFCMWITSTRDFWIYISRVLL